MDADAILTAIDAVLLGTSGSVRTVPAGTFSRRAYDGLDITLAARALEKPRFEVELVSIERTGAVGPRTASIVVEAIELLVRFVWATEHELDDNARRATRAEALEKVQLARQALEWPGNLPSASTGLISSCLTTRGVAKVIRESWRQRLYVVELGFRGLVSDTQAVA